MAMVIDSPTAAQVTPDQVHSAWTLEYCPNMVAMSDVPVTYSGVADDETKQAWTALMAQMSMVGGMRDWQPISGHHEHPQLSSERD